MIPPGVDLEPHLALRRDVRRARSRARRAERLVPGGDLLALMGSWTDPPRNKPPVLDAASQFLHDAFDAELAQRGGDGNRHERPAKRSREPQGAELAGPPADAALPDCGCYGPSDFGTSCVCGATLVVCVPTPSGYCLCTGACYTGKAGGPCDEPPYTFTYLHYACAPSAETAESNEQLRESMLDQLLESFGVDSWQEDVLDGLAGLAGSFGEAVDLYSCLEEWEYRACMSAARRGGDDWIEWCRDDFIAEDTWTASCYSKGTEIVAERENFCRRVKC